MSTIKIYPCLILVIKPITTSKRNLELKTSIWKCPHLHVWVRSIILMTKVTCATCSAYRETGVRRACFEEKPERFVHRCLYGSHQRRGLAQVTCWVLSPVIRNPLCFSEHIGWWSASSDFRSSHCNEIHQTQKISQHLNHRHVFESTICMYSPLSS